MKHKYLLAACLLGALSRPAQAQTTAWRPFRPDVVYGFAQAGTTPTTIHTLRVDSTYATTSGDSVYTFNRLMRHPGTSNLYLKSRNNLVGARLRWQPGTTNYYLEANAEPILGGSATPTALLLKPRAAVGSTWAASTSPSLTATLSSRTLGVVGSTPDSIATIVLSNGQSLLVSKHYGLVAGPQWLTLSTGSTLPATWQQVAIPKAGLGDFDPRQLLTLGVGDEIGYQIDDLAMFSPACYTGFRLRRILSRQQTADSLSFIYQEQDLITTFGWPTCGGTPGTALSTVRRGRWAFSLRTGISPQFPYLALLAGEYRSTGSTSPTALYLGQGYWVPSSTTNCLTMAPALPFVVVYGGVSSTPSSPSYYGTGIDAAYISYTFSAGLGVGLTQFQYGYLGNLLYYRRGGTTCGQAASFASLLPSRAAQAAAAATLHPNPATDAATLTLNEPTQPGSTLVLTDVLGRQVWRTAVVANQTTFPIPLASRPAGLYLVQLLTPGAAPLTWKLNH